MLVVLQFENLGLERSYYDSARVALEERVTAAPEVAGYYSRLGIACAGLGVTMRRFRREALAPYVDMNGV